MNIIMIVTRYIITLMMMMIYVLAALLRQAQNIVYAVPLFKQQ